MNPIFTLITSTTVLALVIYYAWWCAIRQKLLELKLRSYYDQFHSTIHELKAQDHPLCVLISRREAACIRAALDITLPTLHDFEVRIGRLYVPKPAASGIPRLDEAINLLRFQKAEAVAFHAEWYRLSGYLWKLRSKFMQPSSAGVAHVRRPKLDTVRLAGETLDVLCDSEMLETHGEPAAVLSSYIRVSAEHRREEAFAVSSHSDTGI